ncbi:putative proline-rich receptor-like protein kinase PERK3 [Iris pallida]|uniref:Proline-rich receptor-like protein kinase PERK3 n=1 Tax=Iris pallida TaxID=29817 RepID=A0AAX6DPJ2_IRIPA|nr:putative proline-rich receptor-like protein kinase PERK3 [Iris pallida]
MPEQRRDSRCPCPRPPESPDPGLPSAEPSLRLRAPRTGGAPPISCYSGRPPLANACGQRRSIRCPAACRRRYVFPASVLHVVSPRAPGLRVDRRVRGEPSVRAISADPSHERR